MEGDPGEHSFEKTKIPGQVRPGEIIAAMKFRGAAPTGEALVKYKEAFEAASEEAEEALEKEQIPLGMRKYIKEYFNRVKPEDE